MGLSGSILARPNPEEESDAFEAEAAAEPKDRSTTRHLTDFAVMHRRSMAIGIGSVVYCAVMNYGGCVWTNSFLKKQGVQRDELMFAGICRSGSNYIWWMIPWYRFVIFNVNN